MNKTIMFLCTLISGIILFGGVASAIPPIGCMPYTPNVLHCWNNGTIEDETWINRSLHDMVNDPVRVSWADYDAFFRVVEAGGGFEDYYPWDGLEASWHTDNTTYWRINATKVYNPAGNMKARLNYTIGQYLNDDYVNLTLSLETNDAPGWESWGGKIHFVRVMKDINIDNDGDIDAINFVNDTQPVGFYLNITENMIIEDVREYIMVGDLDGSPTSNIRWHWTDGSKRKLFLKQNYPGNADVYWMREMQNPIQAGHVYEQSEYWIDAEECVYVIPRGCSYGEFEYLCKDNSTNNCKADVGYRDMLLRFRVKHDAFLGSCVANYGSACFIRGYDNNTGSWVEVPYKTSNDDMLVSMDYDNPTAEYDTLFGPSTGGNSYAWSRYFNFTCRKAGDQYIHAYFMEFADWAKRIVNIDCPTDTTSPLVELQTPLDDSTTTPGLVNFECNSSDLYPLINGSLWGDFSGSWEQNETSSISFDNSEYSTDYEISLSPGVYVWNCEFCDNNGNCGFSSENYTLTIQSPPSVAPDLKSKVISVNERVECNFLCWITKLFSKNQK